VAAAMAEGKNGLERSLDAEGERGNQNGARGEG
jgi:hypothetical protein